ncbi:MAG: glycosyltransferase family 9 protein [Alphaproteobacteria bacterium]|nr:glycosyltransferase family 9 protein [Alphaproteobacteria bacterium]
MLLRLGRFAEGWARFEARRRLPHPAAEERGWNEPRWDGGALDGRTILVHDEQGLGDAIQFARYVPALAARGGRVVLACRAPLVRLFGTLAGVAAVVPRGAAIEPCAVRVPIMSLPFHLGTTVETIPAAPYLAVPPGIVAPSAIAAAAGLRVGIVRAGNPAHARDSERSLAPDHLAPLASVGGVSWFGLQPGGAPLASVLSGAIELGAGFTDLADTAAAIAVLDLVITVDTAVAHLAGALGKRVWILITHVPDWRWLLGRDDSPWYPTARLYRQPARGDWSTVVARLAADLAAAAAAAARGHQP